MAIQGLRTTANFVADARPKNWREGILLLYPNGKMPLTALTSVMKSRKVDDPEFNWWEKLLNNQRCQISAAIDATQTTIPVTSNAITFHTGSLLWIEHTGEILFVTQDPSTDTALNVIRGYSNTTPTALDVTAAGRNPFAFGLGNANEEGSLAPTGMNYDPVKRYNYTQIFRDTLEATRTATKTRLRTGDQIQEAKRECLETHGIGMEKALWFSKRMESTKEGKPIRTMNGVYQQMLPSNIFTTGDSTIGGAAGSLTMAGLEEFMYWTFKYGSSEKVGFCGNRSLLAIGQAVRKNSAYQIFANEKEYGMKVTRFVTPYGEVVFKTHPLFNQITSGTTNGTAYYGLETWLWCLDMDNLQYVYFEGADTQYQPSLQQNGMDGVKSGYLTEASMELHHPLSHTLLTGAYRGIADA